MGILESHNFEPDDNALVSFVERGLPIPETTIESPEHRLYELLSRSDPDSAHSRYNALVRRLVSYERAAECVS